MRHDDERRVSSTLQDAREEELLSNPEALLTKYQGMAVRDSAQRARVSGLEAQLRKQTSELRVLRAEAARSSDQNLRRKQELAEVNQMLYDLRRSWRVRVGKVLTEPLRQTGMMHRRLRKLKCRIRSQSVTDTTAMETGAAAANARAHGSAVPEDLPEVKHARLLESVAADPRTANVISLIEHSYFTMGNIREPAALAAQHKGLLEEADPKVTKLVSVLGGLDRLYDQELHLPARQSNAGYVAEGGRVMYCVHSTASYNSNGYSTRTAGISGALAELGEDIVVMARPGYPWDAQIDRPMPPRKRFEAEVNGVRHIYTPGPSWGDDPIDHYLQQAADSYVREAIKHRVSAIHAASNYVTAYPALTAARRLGIPFVYEVRGLWEVTEASAKPNWESTERFRFAEQMEKAVANNADGILAITSQVAQKLVERGATRGKIQIAPNAVDPEIFSPLLPHRKTRERLGIPAGTVVLGYAGSLVVYEGLADLLEAMKIIGERQVDVRLVIVGDGPVLADLKEQARDLNIADQVIFTGRVSPTEVAKYISIFDIMPCPRRSLPVTQLVPPLKPMEAMASGKPVIFSDLAPLRDIGGGEGERAILFEAGNVDSLAASIVRLVEDPRLRSDVGRRARQWILQKRTWGIVSQVVRDEYTRVMDRKDLKASASRPLKDLTIALIADEFTTEGLRSETSIVELMPDSWERQLDDNQIGALIVESAWEGKSGQWQRKVGYYDEESFGTLRAILDRCRKSGIPTIFWNKEDPIHFKRFVKSSTFFEHVFTTDSNSVIEYLRNAGATQRTVSSLPFYAQPELHNPLPSQKEYLHTVAYAGSYYGDRYARRSEQLRTLLSAATSSGLTIYDRQHLNPESPYEFPSELGRYVAGGLPYVEMVEAYKAHPIHINVNSVEDSPTMFSRRVVEIAASGAAVVSGPGVGVDDVFDGRIPVVSTSTDAQMLIERLMTQEGVRKGDAWLAMRTVFRAHTAAHRLTYMLRTAGLTVEGPALPSYVVVVDDLTDSLLAALHAQSVRPSMLLYFGPDNTSLKSDIETRPYSYQELENLRRRDCHWVGRLPHNPIDRTYFEDMLSSTLYGSWSTITTGDEGWGKRGESLAQPVTVDADSPGMKLIEHLDASGGDVADILAGSQRTQGQGLRLTRYMASPKVERAEEAADNHSPARQKVVVAGHDLKFATRIIEDFQERGHEVVIDQWLSHSEHDEEFSAECIKGADTIFCEWALGAAVWYSRNKTPRQKLTVRFHSQELFTVFPERIATEAVDKFVFVGPHIRDTAVRDFGFSLEKCVVISNYVDNDALAKPKEASARFNVGLVGMVPQSKRLDRALDVLAVLRNHDERFKLFIKGKTPDDYPWMASRPDELAFYEAQDRRMEEDPLLSGAVTFDGFSSDMGAWYQKIGVALSVSDFESFHLTLADGAASGAFPAAIAWPGADRIYPSSWIHPDVESISASILDACQQEAGWRTTTADVQLFAVEAFAMPTILDDLARLILIGDGKSGK